MTQPESVASLMPRNLVHTLTPATVACKVIADHYSCRSALSTAGFTTLSATGSPDYTACGTHFTGGGKPNLVSCLLMGIKRIIVIITVTLSCRMTQSHHTVGSSIPSCHSFSHLCSQLNAVVGMVSVQKMYRYSGGFQ